MLSPVPLDTCSLVSLLVTYDTSRTHPLISNKLSSSNRSASEKWTGTADEKRDALESVEASMDEVLADAVYDYDDERAEDALADYAAKVRSSCDY